MMSSRYRCCAVLVIAFTVIFASLAATAATPATQPSFGSPPVSVTPGNSPPASITPAKISPPAVAGKSPATQPAKAKDPVPKDWVKINNTKYNYSFFVPKKWDKDTVNDTQADFRLPAPKNKEPPIFLFAGGDCHVVTLDEQVTSFKKDLADQHPKAKVTKDEATTLGGRPAWLLITEESIQHTVTPQVATQKPHTVTQKIDTLAIVYVQGKSTFSVSYFADSSAFSDNLRTVQRVIDTFAWDDAAKAQEAKP